MGEANWHPKLTAILGAQLGAYPLAVTGRISTQIYHHIKDLAYGAADKLPLGLRGELVMKAT